VDLTKWWQYIPKLISMTIQQEIAQDPRVALYRLFDDADHLLYVGITVNPDARFAEHARTKPWWPDVATRAVAWCDNRGIAVAAEAAAIKSEQPVHNDRGKLGLGRGVHQHHPLAYRPPAQVRELLMARAERDGCAVSAVISEALRRYLSPPPPGPR
jgi:predicted GIY-YIG superfamily endonuclease